MDFFRTDKKKRNNFRTRMITGSMAGILVLLPVAGNVYADPAAETTAADQEKLNAIEQEQKAVQNQIDALKQQKGQTEGQLNSAQGQISSLQGEKSNIGGQIDDVNTSIVQSIASIQLLETQIEELETQIEIKQEEYDEAKAEEKVQYEAMKNRIRFMYERGETGYIQLLLNAESFSDMLNKTEYVEQLYEYDRNMLEKFQEIQRVVAAAQEALEEEKSELEESQRGLEQEKASLEVQMNQLRAKYSDYEARIASAQRQAQALREQVTRQQAQLSALTQQQAKKAEEARKLKETAAAAAASKNRSTQTTGTAGGFNSQSANANLAAKKAAAPNRSYNAPGSASGSNVVSYASQFVGNPYVWGGTSLTNGADCSGFTMSVYSSFGYSLPRTAEAQRNAGTSVDSLADAKAGDLLCYAGHVGIYCGDGTIVHASSARTGIKYSVATYRPIICIRRIIN